MSTLKRLYPFFLVVFSATGYGLKSGICAACVFILRNILSRKRWKLSKVQIKFMQVKNGNVQKGLWELETSFSVREWSKLGTNAWI